MGILKLQNTIDTNLIGLSFKYLPIKKVYMAYKTMCAILSSGMPSPHEMPGTLELGINDKITMIIDHKNTAKSFFPNLLKNLH
jgi:hypothetical protein